jgi:transposase
MAKPIGPRKIYRYSVEFQATAVRLSHLSGVTVNEVAQSLDVHPFQLSRWRRAAREGRLVTSKVKLDDQTKAELKELRQVKRAYERLKEEHDLLKKAIRFVSERRAKSSSSSKPTRKRTESE